MAGSQRRQIPAETAVIRRADGALLLLRDLQGAAVERGPRARAAGERGQGRGRGLVRGRGRGGARGVRASGARNVVSSGSLCKARNDALRYAKQRGKFCVQLSDDIHGFTFMHQKSEWHKQSGGLNEDGHTKPSSLTESNKIAARATTRRLSALGAAQMLAAQMKKTDCKFGGLYVNSNPGTAQMCAPIMREHFCIGDFFVVDPASTCSFDEEMRLKEDYDFTCSQLRAYGKVCRFNRLLLHAELRERRRRRGRAQPQGGEAQH